MPFTQLAIKIRPQWVYILTKSTAHINLPYIIFLFGFWDSSSCWISLFMQVLKSFWIPTIPYESNNRHEDWCGPPYCTNYACQTSYHRVQWFPDWKKKKTKIQIRSHTHTNKRQAQYCSLLLNLWKKAKNDEKVCITRSFTVIKPEPNIFVSNPRPFGFWADMHMQIYRCPSRENLGL